MAAQGVPGLYRVAVDSAANNWPHLAAGDEYNYPETAVPLSVVGALDPLRRVAFGNPLSFHFAGLQPGARYRLRLSFLSDSNDRTLRISCGGTVLQESLKLPAARFVTIDLELPQQAYRQGAFDLRIAALTGPNAVASTVEVWSTSPTALAGLEPVALPGVPRLTPLPAAVNGLKVGRLDLNGLWQFRPAPATDWRPIQVPGEWVMQGFTVAPGVAAGYRNDFVVPASWAGYRVKLRCDAVYSDATVWVNGRPAGGHLGGFTPFELDVTGLVRVGQRNRMALAVKNESLADTMASGTRYAAHALGGITRNLYLFAVPALNVSSLQVATTFDHAYRNATLRVMLQVANERSTPVSHVRARLTLVGPNGRPVAIRPAVVELPTLQPGQSRDQVVEIPVTAPAAWDPEHPNLYRLTCRLDAGPRLGAGPQVGASSTPLQTVTRRFGFRQVEIRGNQLFVNNRPVKLRGVCRHEVHPLRGRSLTPQLWRRDAEIFRAANVNYIRTSHYPPAEEFIDACDELGLFVEEEAPFCWASNNSSRAALPYTMQAELEMVQRDRSHPSIIQWSLANESNPWARNFEIARKSVRELDPTRPNDFEIAGGLGANPTPPLEIDVVHYPGPGDPAGFANHARPVLAGEYCHLNAYNRRELVTDPGVRDAWGMPFAAMWENMRASRGTLGGSIWAAIDDSFFLPDGETVGYGTWGPIDGWRRAKPEYWHMKKAYSPVRVLQRQLAPPGPDHVLRLSVENRQLFTDLRELTITWQAGSWHGRLAPPAVPPGGTGTLSLKLPGVPPAGAPLSIAFTNALGVELERELLPIGPPVVPMPTIESLGSPLSGPPQLVQDAAVLELRNGDLSCRIDRTTGLIMQATRGGKVVLSGGPHLMVLPLNGEGGTQMLGREPSYAPFTEPCTAWQVQQVTAEQTGTRAAITVSGAYREAAGQYTVALDAQGMLTISYRFILRQDVNPRQWGLVFDLPRAFDTLTCSARPTGRCIRRTTSDVRPARPAPFPERRCAARPARACPPPGRGRRTAMPWAPTTSARPRRISTRPRCHRRIAPRW